MKTLVITVCLIGAAFAIPNHSLKNQLKERKHSFLEKNNRRFPDTSESKEIKEYKRNNTENVQPIYDHSESREMERPQIDRTKDQIPNEQGYSIQNQLENKADYQNSQLDTFNIFSREYLRDLDTSERTTMSYNVSQTEANESLSHEDIDETENRDNGISEEYPSKEEDQVTLLRQISQGTQEVHSDSLERDAHEYNSSVHLFENDDMEQLSEEGNGGKILQRQPIGSDEDRQDIEPAEDRVNSNLDMEETSQNPSHVTLKDSGFYEGIQGIFANILEATFGGEKVNANSTENEDDVDVLQSKADSESDQHNREMEDAARSQSLYEAVFLDATNVNIKDKSVDAVESKDSMKLPEMRSQASRSDGAPVFQDNRNLADEGHEHLHIDGNAQQTQEGDGSADANETGEERRINTNGLINANAQIQEPINMTSLEEMIDSASESKENVTAFASLNYDAGGLMNQELKENMVDPCQDFHCKQGKICDLDEEGVPKCVCQDADSCPRTILLDQVCGTDNKTYDSECHLFATKCQLEGTKRGSQLHLDYKGSCKHIPPCSEYELAQFPLRMRDWLKNVLVQLYESDRGVTGFLTEKQRNKVKKIYQHEKRLMNGNHTLDLLLRDFEKNYRMYVYPVHWQFSQLDHHPADRRLSHSELALLRAPLVPMEHCITDFFKACNTDKNKYVSLKEWGLCFGLKEDINWPLQQVPGRRRARGKSRGKSKEPTPGKLRRKNQRANARQVKDKK